MGGRRIILFAAAASLAALTVASAQAAPKDKGKDRGKRDETTILVKFERPGYDNDDLVQQDGDEAAGSVGGLRTKTVIVRLKPGASVDDKIAEYEAREDVIYAEENGTMDTEADPVFTSQAGQDPSGQAAQGGSGGSAQGGGFPDDPYFSQQWGVTDIHALEAWPVFPGSYTAPAGPALAIVDSGVDSLHPDLFGSVATDLGANCLTGVCSSDGAADDYGHGTHVAGIAAAHANDATGIAGVAFNAPIIPVKALDAAGNGTYASIASGIIWATDHGARVINLSLGSTSYSQTVCDAVSYALAYSVVVVAAAGNYGTSTAFYPAACPGAIGVGAVDSTDTRASFSQTAYPNIFLSAPGVGILSDFPGNQLKTDSGTSMAAPFVSAVAALLIGQSPGRLPRDVKMLLAGSSDKVGSAAYGSDPYATCVCTWNASYGYGRVNAYRALSGAPPAATPDYAIGTSTGTVTVQRGKSGTVTVSSSSSTGFTSSIGMSVTGLPAGVTASFNPTSITGVGSSTLTLTASTSAAYGTYALTVKGTSGALVRTAPLTVVVPAPDYTLKLSPTSSTVVQGDKPTTTISLNNLFGFAGTVSLSVGGQPAGVTTSLGSTSISGTRTSTLTIATATSTVPGTYSLTVTGTSGSLVRTAVYKLTVAQAVPDFTISSATMATSVRYGRATTIAYKLTLGPKYGFKGTISMSLNGNPPSSTCTWTPQTVSITSTTAVTTTCSLAIPAGAPVGTYNVNFTGTSGSLTRTVSPKITIS